LRKQEHTGWSGEVTKASRARRVTFTSSRGRGPPGFHSSMPRSNPHARERVMDDGKHLDALASFAPFAGRETSGVSSAGSSRGSAVQTPTRASVTKRCSRLRRVGALLFDRGILDSGLSARADETSRPQGRGTRHRHGSLSRTRRQLRKERSADENRSDGKLTVVLPCDVSRVGPAAIRRRRADRAPARPCRRSEEPTFRRVVLTIVSLAEVGRTASSS